MSNKEVVERDQSGNIVKLYRYDANDKIIFTHENEWKDGRIARKTSYGPEGNMTASFEYSYDERGNNTEGTWFASGNGILMKAEFVYDDMNRIVEKTHFGTGTIATNKTYQRYNEAGQLASSVYYEVWPESEPIYTYREYDEKGFLLKSITEDAGHQVLHYETFTPNKWGKVAEYTSFDGNDRPVYTYKYYFDESGNKTKSERYDGEGNLVSTGF